MRIRRHLRKLPTISLALPPGLSGLLRKRNDALVLVPRPVLVLALCVAVVHKFAGALELASGRVAGPAVLGVSG